jgi:hypothetical protein
MNFNTDLKQLAGVYLKTAKAIDTPRKLLNRKNYYE